MHTGVDHVGRRAAREETAGRLAAERLLEQLLGFTDGLRPGSIRCVEDHAIGLDDVGHVFCALHPALDLEAHDPGFGEEVGLGLLPREAEVEDAVPQTLA